MPESEPVPTVTNPRVTARVTRYPCRGYRFFTGTKLLTRTHTPRPQKPRPEPRLKAFESRSPSPRPCEAAITACHGSASRGSALTAFGFWAEPSTSLLYTTGRLYTRQCPSAAEAIRRPVCIIVIANEIECQTAYDQ